MLETIETWVFAHRDVVVLAATMLGMCIGFTLFSRKEEPPERQQKK